MSNNKRGNLKELVNVKSPSAAAGVRKNRLDDPTVDIGALMRRALQPPKLRDADSEAQPEQQARKQPMSMMSNPAFSPEDSLAKAASKLANIKAGNLLKAKTTTLTAPPPTAEASGTPLHHHVPHSENHSGDHTPELETTISPTSAADANRRNKHATPGWRPELEGIPNPKASDEVPLAARTLMTKRNRRKSVYQRPARYGDWWTGDDTELDQMVEDYNEDDVAAAEAEAERQRQKEKERSTRARRKSAFPAIGRSAAAASLAEADSEPIVAKPKAKDDVADQVRASVNDLCSQLDGLIEPESDEARRAADDKSLREKLLESWEGKSYYDRLREIAGTTPGRPQRPAEPAINNNKQKDPSKEPAAAFSLAPIAEKQKPAAVQEKPAPMLIQQNILVEKVPVKKPSVVVAPKPAAAEAPRQPAPAPVAVEAPPAAPITSSNSGPSLIKLSARGAKPMPAPWEVETEPQSGTKETEAEIAALRAALKAANADKDTLANELSAVKQEINTQNDSVKELEAALAKERATVKAEVEAREAAERRLADANTLLNQAASVEKPSGTLIDDNKMKQLKQAALKASEVEGRLTLAEVQAQALIEAANSLLQHVANGKEEVAEIIASVNAGIAVEDKKENTEDDQGQTRKSRPRRKSTWR